MTCIQTWKNQITDSGFLCGKASYGYGYGKAHKSNGKWVKEPTCEACILLSLENEHNIISFWSDTDFWDYFPIAKEIVPSSMKMDKFKNLPKEQQTVFQIHKKDYTRFLTQKYNPNERNKEYFKFSTPVVNIKPINDFIMSTLCKEYPDVFVETAEGIHNLITDEVIYKTHYNHPATFNSLAKQVPEDLVVCTVRDDGTDFVSYVHLMSPNGWTASSAINQSFLEIHREVTKANGDLVIKDPQKLIRGILRSGNQFQRVGALSFRTSPDYVRMPNEIEYRMYSELYLRFERQTVTPFPEINSFLFTIKTYFNDLTRPDRAAAALDVLEKGYSVDVYPREYLNKNKDKIIELLKKSASK